MRKNLKASGQFFFIFKSIFMATWGCASDFLEKLLKFKMAAKGQLHNFLCVQKTLKLSQKLINFYNHIPQDKRIW